MQHEDSTYELVFLGVVISSIGFLITNGIRNNFLKKPTFSNLFYPTLFFSSCFITLYILKNNDYYNISKSAY